ncbi:MAG: EAL domain-containing protein [Aquisalimonadaceae bacterium]
MSWANELTRQAARLALLPSRMRVPAALFSVVLIVAVTWLVYITGGTAYVYPYLMFFPILLSAALFGMLGGVTAAMLAGLALGPFMPLYVVTETAQTTINWVIRLTLLTSIGGFAGMLFQLLRHQLNTIRRLAFRDRDTSLPNRLSLEEDLSELIPPATADAEDNSNPPIHVVSVLLQNFEQINTSLGFRAGSQLMCEVAAALENVLDGKGDVYVLDPGKCGVVFRDMDSADCMMWVNRLLKQFELPVSVEDIPIHLEVTAGIATYPDSERLDAEWLLRKSALAMWTSNSIGQRIASYDHTMEGDMRNTLQLLGELRRAIELDELVMVFQPKFRLSDSQLIGAEALVRWQHPTRGLIPPGMFLPQAEQTALMDPLTLWVVHDVLRRLKAWRETHPELGIAINLSARNLLEPHLPERIPELLVEYQVEPGSLEFELTETMLLRNPDQCIRHLEMLANHGIRLAIDDFGTGYSSLAYLTRLPVDVLKIDQTFIRHIATRDKDRTITAASIDLARRLGMYTVAEGVEDAAAMTVLGELGCDAAQGFYLGRPMSAEDFTAYLGNPALARHH